jgi:hypothetical protein
MPSPEPSRSVDWRPPRPINALSPFEERCIKAKEQPFLDQQLMVDSPLCTWSNFRYPLLRQFPPHAGFDWKERLGHGLDGVVWRAEIGGRTFAVKVVSITP